MQFIPASRVPEGENRKESAVSISPRETTANLPVDDFSRGFFHVVQFSQTGKGVSWFVKIDQ